MSSFSFATASQIRFGVGLRSEAAQLAAQLGSRVLLVCSANSNRTAWLVAALESAGLAVTVGSQAGEPTVADAVRLAELGRERAVQAVIACGGGSILDAGKAAAALAANPGPPEDYLEVVGRGQPLRSPALPLLAIPTTAGTGSEVTRNAALDVPERAVKVSIRHDSMLPRYALLDPELTVSVPQELTVTTGFDALTQVIEPFLSCQSNPLTDALTREGIRSGAKALPAVAQNGRDLAARSSMMFVSLLGGMALANAKLGAVHGFAGPLGGLLQAPHGALCAALLPATLEANFHVVCARGTAAQRERFSELAALLTGDPAPEAGIEWVKHLANKLGVRKLGELGMGREHIDLACAQAERSSSMKGNPVPLTRGELGAILEASL